MKKLFVISAIILFLFGINNKQVFSQQTTFKTWKTIKIGTYKNTTKLYKQLKKKGFKTDRFVKRLFKSNFPIASSVEEIQLVNISVADLGFKTNATLREICTKAKELGLDVCVYEVGPQLRLQYSDQFDGEYLNVVTEEYYKYDPYIFILPRNGNKLWISYDIVNYGDSYTTSERFAFCIKK